MKPSKAIRQLSVLICLVLILTTLIGCQSKTPTEVSNTEAPVSQPTTEIAETAAVEESEPASQPTAETTTEENAEPLVFTYVMASEPETLDPAIWFTTSPLHMNVYQPLLQANNEGSEEPFTYLIAESYTVSDDGLTWVFKIRENMKFHDGTPVNAEAVRASIQRSLDIAAQPSGIWGDVDTMTVLSDYEIEFKLKAPVPFDYIVAAGYGGSITSPAALNEHNVDGDLGQAWLRDNASGTGPWVLKSWERGERIIFERNKEYFGGWEKGQPDIIIVKFVSEYATSRLMLESGEADMVDFIPPDQIEGLSKVEGITIGKYPSFETLYLQFNHKKPPTDDIRVREALSYAFNYDGVALFTNNTTRPMRGLLPSKLWGFNPDAFQYTFDLEKARQILDDAGYKDQKLVVTAYYSSEDEILRQLIEMYKSDLAQINVDLQVENAPFATNKSKQIVFETSANIFTRYWWPDFFDPHDFYYYLLSKSNYEVTYWEDPEVDAMITEAHSLAGVNRQKAIEIYYKLNDIAIKDVNSIWAFEKDYITPMRSWVKNYEYNPAYTRIVIFYDLRIEK
jgi:peptide/nickel transport system substrate-binding protein